MVSINRTFCCMHLDDVGSRSVKQSSQKMVWSCCMCINGRVGIVAFQKLTNFYGKIDITKPNSVPQTMVRFCKDHVCTYWEEKRNLALKNNDRPSVIGPINQRHQWLVVMDQHINLFDVKRLLLIQVQIWY